MKLERLILSCVFAVGVFCLLEVRQVAKLLSAQQDSLRPEPFATWLMARFPTSDWVILAVVAILGAGILLLRAKTSAIDKREEGRLKATLIQVACAYVLTVAVLSMAIFALAGRMAPVIRPLLPK